MSGKGGKKTGVRRCYGAMTAEHHEIYSIKKMSVLAKALAHQTLYSTTGNGAARAFFRDRQPEPRGALAIAPCKNGKAAVDRLYRLREDLPEFAGSAQARQFWKAGVANVGRKCADQGERRARPLARRALMTLHPLRVDMRARKPCVRARLRRLG